MLRDVISSTTTPDHGLTLHAQRQIVQAVVLQRANQLDGVDRMTVAQLREDEGQQWLNVSCTA
jgi:hypothetical protein